MIVRRAVLAALAAIASSAPTHANVTISTATTHNMNCTAGTCEPTATDAVLSVTDLENDLSQFGNVTVMTTGNGVEANNIVVKAPFSSPDSTSLTLDAHKAITINAAVSIGSDAAELELVGEEFVQPRKIAFDRKGHVTFGSLSDIFGINGVIFTLVGSVQGLASAVAANPSGAFALANSYDASQDGTYTSVPIPTSFSGIFEGLGNEISNLSINDSTEAEVGLFAELGSGGILRDIVLAKADVSSGYADVGGVGALAGYSFSGYFLGVVVGGRVRADAPESEMAAGGIVGATEYGGILQSSSSVRVSLSGNQGVAGGLTGGAVESWIDLSSTVGGVSGAYAGALIGHDYGSLISQNYATGSVRGDVAGGLVGEPGADVITNSYAIGDINGAKGNRRANMLGGFMGPASERARIRDCYSLGTATGAIHEYKGGFAGHESPAIFSNDYWNTTTSGQKKGVGGEKYTPGVEGLTTTQLQSGLPQGFDPKIWAENPNINGGLPYLIHNPPPK